MEYSRLDRPERNVETSCDLRLGVAAVVGELQRLALYAWNLLERLLDSASFLPNRCRFFRGRTRLVGHRFRGEFRAAVGRSDEIDRSSVHDRQEPVASKPPPCVEAFRRAPDGQEGILNRFFGKTRIAADAESEPVCDATETVVELRERPFLTRSDQTKECCIGLGG